MPGFKASKDRLTPSRAAKAAGECSLTILKIPGPLIIMLGPLCLRSIHGTAKPGWQHIWLQRGSLSILSHC